MGHVDALLVVAYEASPSHHPAEGAFHDPAPWQNLEPFLVIGSADDLNDEVEIGGLVHQLKAVIGAIGEEMLHPRPALADRFQDRNSTGAVGPEGQRGAARCRQASD